MGDHILVDHPALDSARDDLKNGVVQIGGVLDELEGKLDVLKERWSGEAKIAYDAAKLTWDQAINEMVVALSKHSTLVADANLDFIHADKRGARGFESF
ncbi:MAG: WXG100 family type VII secretion target [Nocardioides sp.]|uniref:WXG100 family type VII secretion target n=1 Tax=Nocardioides sp. TaxID=35761 RepID=UPI0039E2D3CD